MQRIISFQLSNEDTLIMLEFGKEVLVAQKQDLSLLNSIGLKLKVSYLFGYTGKTGKNLFSNGKKRMKLPQNKFHHFCNKFENFAGITPERKKVFQEWRGKIDNFYKAYADRGEYNKADVQGEAKLVAEELKNKATNGELVEPEIIDVKPLEPNVLLPNGERIEVSYKADYIPEPDFYNKKIYDRLLKRQKELKTIYLWYGTAALCCAGYCGHFLWHIFKNADPLGNWWWFGIAALIVFKVLLIYFSEDEYQSSEKRKIDLAIMKLEHYLSNGEYIEDDKYFTRYLH